MSEIMSWIMTNRTCYVCNSETVMTFIALILNCKNFRHSLKQKPKLEVSQHVFYFYEGQLFVSLTLNQVVQAIKILTQGGKMYQ